MRSSALLQDTEYSGRPADRWLIRLAFLALMSSGLSGAAFGQTPAAQPPAIPSWLSDPVAGARCLAGDGCGGGGGAWMACVAEQAVKTIPSALQAEALAFSGSKLAQDCRAATVALAPWVEEIRQLYQHTSQAPASQEMVKTIQDYLAACQTPKLGLNHGPITPAQGHFLGDHIGLIVRQNNVGWLGSQPVCQAARLGRFIVTAQRCIPPETRTSIRPGDYIADIGFRFFNSPTIYGLTLRQLGTETDANEAQHRDYAILEILRTPSLEEDTEALIGTMQPFDDFVTLATQITAFQSRGHRTGDVRDLRSMATFHKNTLCRPAYIASNGAFLHSCLIDSKISLGAPLFQRQNGRYVFVGIHVGDTVSLKEPALAACAPGLNKYGVAIPPTILREVLSK